MTQIFIISILFIINIIFINKYRKLKKIVKEFSEINTKRYGFYKYSEYLSSNYDAYVYVYELDRYTDGYSRIKLDKIEAFNSLYMDSSVSHIKKCFISLKLTNDIEWLESEDYIKNLRKEKLEKIKNL